MEAALEQLQELYTDSGIWAHPILISTLILFAVGWFMLFTVRLVKKFIFYSVIALLLPNSIGVVSYLEETDDLQEAVLERGKEMKEELMESAEDLSFSPLYLGLIGSGLTVLVGLVGIVKTRTRKNPGGTGNHRALGCNPALLTLR